MNDGTFRGGAQAFKLDTLLKLADVKGTDGKTTLLHFVVQEIIRSEGVRAVRMARESGSISSVNSDDLTDDSLHESEDYYCKLGLKVISRFVRLKHIMLDLPTVASVHPCRHGLGAFTVAALILIIATFIPTVAVLYSHHSGSVGFRHRAPSRCYHEGSFSASRIFQLRDSYPDCGARGQQLPLYLFYSLRGKVHIVP
ncbi:hypothetical protein BHE74_00009373 [Ensete ventricosum]|nr:hypothetical protein BHE74_00009373 [Ensete ventricosum]